ncbi:MAG: AAA family ATPase [Candidatus Anstonellales archaeon]
MFDKLKSAFQKLLGKDEDIRLGIVKETVAKIVNVSLSEQEANRISDQLFYDLLDADVPFDLANFIKSQLYRELRSRKFSENYREEIRELLKGILLQYISTAQLDLQRGIIMLIGPNGYGKTTTAVKLAYMLKMRGKRVRIIGADVFRAAAREQLQELCKRYEIDLYVDDSERPLSTIIRGLKSSENYDFIIIDTAGRQDMNINLLRELQNIQQKVNPDLVLYVLESSVGNSSLHQLREYRKFIKIDGIIYTKVDLDSAGGSVLAAGYYGFPLYFITYGQGIQDISAANPQDIVDRII